MSKGIASGTPVIQYPEEDKAKVDNISVTQDVDLDVMENDIEVLKADSGGSGGGAIVDLPASGNITAGYPVEFIYTDDGLKVRRASALQNVKGLGAEHVLSGAFPTEKPVIKYLPKEEVYAALWVEGSNLRAVLFSATNETVTQGSFYSVATDLGSTSFDFDEQVGAFGLNKFIVAYENTAGYGVISTCYIGGTTIVPDTTPDVFSTALVANVNMIKLVRGEEGKLTLVWTDNNPADCYAMMIDSSTEPCFFSSTKTTIYTGRSVQKATVAYSKKLKMFVVYHVEFGTNDNMITTFVQSSYKTDAPAYSVKTSLSSIGVHVVTDEPFLVYNEVSDSFLLMRAEYGDDNFKLANLKVTDTEIRISQDFTLGLIGGGITPSITYGKDINTMLMVYSDEASLYSFKGVLIDMKPDGLVVNESFLIAEKNTASFCYLTGLGYDSSRRLYSSLVLRAGVETIVVPIDITSKEAVIGIADNNGVEDSIVNVTLSGGINTAFNDYYGTVYLVSDKSYEERGFAYPNDTIGKKLGIGLGAAGVLVNIE